MGSVQRHLRNFDVNKATGCPAPVNRADVFPTAELHPARIHSFAQASSINCTLAIQQYQGLFDLTKFEDKMAAAAAEYKDRQFVAVIGDEVRALRIHDLCMRPS